jgi:hypothetical protein
MFEGLGLAFQVLVAVLAVVVVTAWLGYVIDKDAGSHD